MTPMMDIENAVLVWTICGFAGGVIAMNRGRSGFPWLALGLLSGPLGLLYALSIRDDAS